MPEELDYESVQAQHIIGHGKELWFTDLADEAFATATQIIGTVEIGTPEGEWGEADFTNDQSPNFTMEPKPAMYDPGSFTVSYKYAGTEFEKFEGLKLLGTEAETRSEMIKLFKLVLSDGATCIGKGFVKSNGISGDGQEDGVDAEAEIRCAGLWTFSKPNAS